MWCKLTISFLGFSHQLVVSIEGQQHGCPLCVVLKDKVLRQQVKSEKTDVEQLFKSFSSSGSQLCQTPSSTMTSRRLKWRRIFRFLNQKMIQLEQQDEPDELKTFCDVFQVLKQSSYVLYSEGVCLGEWSSVSKYLNSFGGFMFSQKKKKKEFFDVKCINSHYRSISTTCC